VRRYNEGRKNAGAARDTNAEQDVEQNQNQNLSDTGPDDQEDCSCRRAGQQAVE